MRQRLYLTAVLALLLVATFGLDSWSREAPFDHIIERLEDAIHHEAWAEAQESFHSLQSDWTERKRWLLLTQSHLAIDQVDVIVAQLGAAVALERQFEAVERLVELKEIWKDIQG